MKKSTLFLIALMSSGVTMAQGPGVAPVQKINTPIVEDFKPTPVNQPGSPFPQVNSEGRVRTQIFAPEAKKVQLDIGAVKYDMVKDEKGMWTGESAPQDVGFHYYQLNIDGASVPDPGSLFFFGA